MHSLTNLLAPVEELKTANSRSVWVRAGGGDEEERRCGLRVERCETRRDKVFARMSHAGAAALHGRPAACRHCALSAGFV